MSNKTITEATDEELQFELKARKVARIAQQREERNGRLTRLCLMVDVNPVIIDVLAPQHSRNDCNDVMSLENGRMTPEHPPRCVRCALIRLNKDGVSHFVEPYTIEVRIVKAEIG